MSHYHCEVWLATTDDFEDQVKLIMDPFIGEYDKDDGDKMTGWWDWYVIGGRWTGVHSESYNPAEDRENWAKCEFCGGTGTRYWKEGAKQCNACGITNDEGDKTYPFGVGMKLNWGYVPFSGDIMRLDSIPPDLSSYSLLLKRGDISKTEVFHAQRYNEDGSWENSPPDIFVDTEYADTKVKEFLKSRGIEDGFLVTVDYHC